MASLPRIVVFGGSGFLGKQICKAATQKGWTVTSLSRSGEPLWAESPSSADGNKPAWSSKVQWKKADIFNADSYDYVLRDVDAVVHTMGILLENDYKKFISGEKSPLALLSSSLLGSGGGTGASRRLPPGNPLLKTNKGMPEYVEQDRDAHVQEERVETSAGKLTYERINRDSAITLAQSFLKHSISARKAFCYISAAGAFPMLPQRYITTKREAEQSIGEMHDLRTLFIRPGFLFSSERGFTMPMSYAVTATSILNKASGGILSGILGGAAQKPLDTEIVGQAIVRAIANGLSGVVEVDDIERLSKEVWREGML